MPVVTVHNIPEATYRALKVRAVRNRHSIEAEIRKILEDAVGPHAHVKLGSELAAFGRTFGGLELNTQRDQAPFEPAVFE